MFLIFIQRCPAHLVLIQIYLLILKLKNLFHDCVKGLSTVTVSDAAKFPNNKCDKNIHFKKVVDL